MSDGRSRFTFFWHGPFSQWHACDFTVEGVAYNCAEQYMMARKAALFGDDEMARKIMATASPKRQKGLGRKVGGFDENKWNGRAREVVYLGNSAKFSQNPELKALLLATGDTTLVEASPVDRIWGIGLGEDDPQAWDRATWRGKNWLGEVLTRVRDDLRAAGADARRE